MKTRTHHLELPQVAAHELGHAILAREAGVRVKHIKINRRTGNGVTSLDLPKFFTERAQLRAFMVGMVAGFAAETLWCDRYGGAVLRINSAFDFTQFDEYRDRAWLTERRALAEARTVLDHHWGQLEHLVPVLCAKGRIVPW